MEDGEFCCQQEEVRIQGGEIQCTVIAKIGDYIDDGGGDEADNQGFQNEEPWMITGKGRVLDHCTDITEEDDGPDDYDQDNVS